MGSLQVHFQEEEADPSAEGPEQIPAKGFDLDQQFATIGMANIGGWRFARLEDPARRPVGRLHQMFNCIRATCSVDGHRDCKLMVNLQMRVPAQPGQRASGCTVRRTVAEAEVALVRWFATGVHQDRASHQREAEEVKVSWRQGFAH